LVTATIVHFEAQERRAEANLRVYLTHAVGVSQHPDFVEELVVLTKRIAEARECIVVLGDFHVE
jgi:hypothetical protein